MHHGRKKVALYFLVVCVLPLFCFAEAPATPMQVAFFNKPQAAILTNILARVWDNAAKVMQKQYVLVKADSEQQAMQWLNQNKVSVVIGPMRLKKNTQNIDYINSYIHDSIGIVIPDHGRVSFVTTIKGYFEALFGITVLAILIIIGLFGVLIWLVEHRKNRDMYSSSPAKGIATSVWNCLVTFSTVGYGDIVPKTLVGRILTGLWIIISLFLVSAFVASITSELTYTKTKFGKLSSLSELYDKKVAVVEDEPNTEGMAKSYHVDVVKYKSLMDMLQAVADKKVTAGFANIFLLKEQLTKHPELKVTLTPYELNVGSYAFAIHMGNPIQPELTRALYTLSEVGRIRSIIEDYVGTLRTEKKG